MFLSYSWIFSPSNPAVLIIIKSPEMEVGLKDKNDVYREIFIFSQALINPFAKSSSFLMFHQLQLLHKLDSVCMHMKVFYSIFFVYSYSMNCGEYSTAVTIGELIFNKIKKWWQIQKLLTLWNTIYKQFLFFIYLIYLK